MEPFKSELPEDIFAQLHKALSVVYGIEPYIVLKDIWNESSKQVETTVLWMAKALIESAQQQALARLNSNTSSQKTHKLPKGKP
jgi:hypothetical protein